MDDLLKGFADNQLLFDAVKVVVVKHFSLDDIGMTYDNETLGQMVRARVDGLKKVEEAFKEIERHKTASETRIEQKNPAR